MCNLLANAGPIKTISFRIFIQWTKKLFIIYYLFGPFAFSFTESSDGDSVIHNNSCKTMYSACIQSIEYSQMYREKAMENLFWHLFPMPWLATRFFSFLSLAAKKVLRCDRPWCHSTFLSSYDFKISFFKDTSLIFFFLNQDNQE